MEKEPELFEAVEEMEHHKLYYPTAFCHILSPFSYIS